MVEGRVKIFDRKFGESCFRTLPTTPGVYFFRDQAGALIYIGKAKNLRRRLGQYRNAKRCKKHRKMREIVKDAVKIEYQVCASDLEASLLELELIQQHQPRWNVAGAFFFLYPLIGLRESGSQVSFCFTTRPELLQDFEFHGAYRSRYITWEAFSAWMSLLELVAHRCRAPKGERKSSSYVYTFRQLSPQWLPEWRAFLKGESLSAFESLILALVENAAARKKGKEIQEKIDALKRFWRHEARALKRARTASGTAEYPISQKSRDAIFLRYRHRETRREASP